MVDIFSDIETGEGEKTFRTESPEEIRLRLKSEVGNNTEEAIFELEKELRKDSSLYSELLICKNKYKSISAEHHRGTISDNERSLHHSKLLDTLLTLIDRIEKKDLSAFQGSDLDKAPSLIGEVRKRSRTSLTSWARQIWNLSFGVTTREIIISILLYAVLLFQFSVQPWLVERRLKHRIAQEKAAPPSTQVEPSPPLTNSYSPTDFEVIERRTTVDFRGWKKVPVQLMKTDRVEPMIWRQLLKIQKKGESKTFVATHVTDGYTIDFACISPAECIKRVPTPVIPKDGAAKYTKFELEFDVSKYVSNQEFQIEYQAVYWNANQKAQADSMAVIARNPTKRLIFEIYFSELMEDKINFRYAEEPDNLDYHEFPEPIINTLANKHLEWEIPNPSLKIYYGVQWKWKRQASLATTTVQLRTNPGKRTKGSARITPFRSLPT